MRERSAAYVSDALSVDAFHSVYHFNLTARPSRGELHDFYEIVFVENGFYHVLLDGEPFIVDPGSAIFFAPNTFHSGDGVTKSTATVYILSFSTDSALMRCFDNRVFVLSEGQRALLLRVFQLAEGALLRHRGGGISLRADASVCNVQKMKKLFELFLLELYDGENAEASGVQNSRKKYRKERFRRISDYLKENLSRTLTVETIATECAIGVTGLKELCREFCGCGPIDYLISLRILASKELIRESELNFTEIAEKTGFGSLHYFSRVFKERTGMTPTEYAKAP